MAEKDVKSFIAPCSDGTDGKLSRCTVGVNHLADQEISASLVTCASNMRHHLSGVQRLNGK